MIKLELPPKPEFLSDEFVRTQTEKYIKNKSEVWNRGDLRKAVLAIAYSKCCYCECELNTGNNVMEIDHFLPKSKHPEKVLEWGNLLPSSRACNNAKGQHDVFRLPIINPCIDNPKEHLWLDTARYYSKTELGKLTIRVLDLNHFLKHIKPRFEIQNHINDLLQEIWHNYTSENEFRPLLSDEQRILYNKVEGLMHQGTKSLPYSALTATTILANFYYPKIEDYLRASGLWNEHIEALREELVFCSLPKPSNFAT